LFFRAPEKNSCLPRAEPGQDPRAYEPEGPKDMSQVTDTSDTADGLTEAEQQYPLPPSLLDGRHYTDPQQYRRELTRIFLRSWFPVCPVADIAAPRDVVVWDQLEQSVVISRLDDGTISAWHNVCQHRGARLVAESGTCPTGGFNCPWHGFSYNLDGEVTGVPLRDSFDEAELVGLRTPRARAVEWGGWVWLALSDDVPELAAYLGALGEGLGGYGLERFQTRYRESLLIEANWKFVIDAFNETWHVPFTHKATLGGLVMWRDAALKLVPPHSWMTLPLRGFTDRVRETDPRKSHICHYLVFPNTIFSCFPTHLQMWSAWPVSPTQTVLKAYGIVGPTPPELTDEAWDRHNERDWGHFMDVLREDVEILAGIGSVVNSLGFRRNMFNTAEGRLTSFHAEVNARAAEEVS
jgi:choline monooxygenase